MSILLRAAQVGVSCRLAATAVDFPRTYVSMPALLSHVSKASRLYRVGSVRWTIVLRETRSVSERFGNVIQPIPSWEKESSQLRERGLVCAICTLDGPRGFECG